MRDDRFEVELECTRNRSHKAIYMFRVAGKKIQKIGQFPSLADISTPDLNQYRKVLGGQRLTEMKKATGLMSHGVGIGAFVYLRRIFESILWEHRKQLEEGGQKIEGFDTKRMDEKIEALKDTLPPFLVQNRHVYGILSKGLHELSEEECKTYFPAVYKGILMIVRQDEERRRRSEEEKEVAVALQQISSQLAAKAK